MDGLDDIVRSSDRLRYTATLYAPAEKRSALLVLYAFNIEIARIRDLVSEPMAGEVRLQWWRDALATKDLAGNDGHKLVGALRRVISQNDLPFAAFDNMLEARRLDLYSDPLPMRSDLEGYCGDTGGALIQLSNLILDAKSSASAGEATGHAGCALAIAGLLSLLPISRDKGQCFIPVDILQASGATPEDIAAPKPGDAVRRALAAMIALGREHVSAFESRVRSLPSSLRPSYLPAATAAAWLNAVERAGDDAFHRSITLSPLRQSSIAFRRAMFGWR